MKIKNMKNGLIKILLCLVALTLVAFYLVYIFNIKNKPKSKYSTEITPNKHKRKPIILDPGHGGDEDSGTKIAMIYEDEIAYDISVRVRKLLIENDYKVHQTIYDSTTKFELQNELDNNYDEFLMYGNGELLRLEEKFLTKRCSLINSIYDLNQNPILVSIHINSDYSFIQGACFFHPSKKDSSSEEAELKSIKLAEKINQTFENNRIPTHSVDFFGLKLNVLRNILPYNKFILAIFNLTELEEKILIECANIRNKTDLKRLLTQEGRQEIANAIYQGIVSYCKNMSN